MDVFRAPSGSADSPASADRAGRRDDDCSSRRQIQRRPRVARHRHAGTAGATVAIAFGELGLVALRAICRADHAASLRVLAKLGFEETRRFVDHHPKWPKGWPHVELRLTRPA